MKNESQWYSDAGRLLREVRRSSLHWGRIPDIAGYDELIELRRGGQGVVYRARQRSTNRIVAIKVLPDEALASEATRVRFQREIELAASLRHRNIVRVYDSGFTSDGRLFYVMEYVQGRPVDDPGLAHVGHVRRSLELFAQICDALQHAHQRGVIHRDLKPGNILVDESGTPQVLDFGIAKIAGDGDGDSTGLKTVSQTGQFLGSLAWASPEQIEGDPDRIDTRTDIYSLGVILYQLLTGRLPQPVSPNLRATLEAIMAAVPPRPRSLRPEIPDDAEAITLRCLAREPDRRYESAAALGRDIRRSLAGEPIEAKRTLVWHRMQRAVKRYRYTAVAAVLALGVFFSFGATMSVLYRRTTEAESLAQARLTEVRRQTRQAEAVTAFLRGTLMSVDPARTGGREITVREMLDRAAARVGADLALDPMARAMVSQTLGGVYFNLGGYEQAGDLLANAVRLYRAQIEQMAESGEDPCLARSGLGEALQVLGKTRSMQGRLDESEALHEQALDIWRNDRFLGPGKFIETVTDLALIKAQRGELRPAAKLLQDLLDRDPAPPPSAGVYLALAQFRLGQILSFLGDDEAAEQRLRDALGVFESVYGDNSLAVSDCRISLALLLARSGRPEEAIELATAALEADRAVVGPTHQRIATAFGALAVAHTALGDDERAEQHYLQAIDMLRDIFGDRHPQVAHALEQYGTFLYQRNRIDESMSALREALAIYEDLHPPGHQDIAIVRSRLGCCLVKAGRFDEAEPLLRDGLAVLAERLGDEHAETVMAAGCLAELEAAVGSRRSAG